MCINVEYLISETYDEFHAWSVEHYPEFWAEVWDFTGVKYSQKYTQVRRGNINRNHIKLIRQTPILLIYMYTHQVHI